MLEKLTGAPNMYQSENSPQQICYLLLFELY